MRDGKNRSAVRKASICERACGDGEGVSVERERGLDANVAGANIGKQVEVLSLLLEAEKSSVYPVGNNLGVRAVGAMGAPPLDAVDEEAPRAGAVPIPARETVTGEVKEAKR